MRRRTIGQTIAGLVWMLVSGAIFSLLGGLAFQAFGPIAVVVLFMLMFLGGLVTALVAHALGIDEELGTAATVAVVVGLMPGAPLTAYWLGGRGDSVEVSSAADAIAKRDARYFHVTAPRPDAARAVMRRYSHKRYLYFDMLTPIADAGGAPRVFVLHADVHSVHSAVAGSAAEAKARARYQELIAETGSWFRRTEVSPTRRDAVRGTAGAEPWLFLEPVASADRDRFRRGIWLYLLAGVATAAVGAYAFATRFAPAQERDRKRGPYR